MPTNGSPSTTTCRSAAEREAEKLSKRLVGQAKDVLQLPLLGEVLDLGEFLAAAHKTEGELGIFGQPGGRIEQRVQGMARAMVARIHDDEFFAQAVLRPETKAAPLLVADGLIVRPWGEDINLVAADPLGHDAVLHEAVEHDDAIGAAKAVAEHAFERSRQERPLPQPAGGNRLVGVEVHNPGYEPCPLSSGEECSQNGNQRGRGHCDDHVAPRQYEEA